MAVTNPAKMSSIKTEFAGPNNFSLYVRGGSYVSASAPSQISTTAVGLAMSQFNGVTAYIPPTLTGVHNLSGFTDVSLSNATIVSGSFGVTGGVGPYTYSTTYVSGTSFTINNANTSAPSFVRTGRPGAGTVTGTYQTTVTDSTGHSSSGQYTVTDNRS
jgi:hypothetical protein